MKKHRMNICAFVCSLIAICSCTAWKNPAVVLENHPEIYPDYVGVTVPVNIAPLNFMVEDAAYIQAVLCVGGEEVFRASGKDGVVRMPLKSWRKLMAEASGSAVSVEVSVWNEEYPDGVRYSPFEFNVASDPVDGWLAYRLIEPGYEGWRQLGIYQRDLTSFEESAIVTNRHAPTSCVNCHNFPSYSPESMMFHARGAKGGTILYDAGVLNKIDFRTIGAKKNTTYPAWHPSGKFIAFSSNTTHQIFFAEGKKPVEVFDTASDLVLYDVKTGEALTDPRFLTEDVLETFPAWSHDGKYLYFAAHKAEGLPVVFTPDMQYSLMRVSFDEQTRTFGQTVETLYDAPAMGGSVSYPRLSPDGKYLLYTRSDYGTFPIWHREADLCMLELATMDHVDVSIWNDESEADSYHSWSSDGRWAVFGSRRLDGRYTRLFIAYMDREGRPHKPFLLPQEDPNHNVWRMRSYNVPEFISGKVTLPKEAEELFRTEN